MDTTSKNKMAGTESEEQLRDAAKKQALEKVNQKAVIVNVDELAEAEARKAADAYMTEDKGKVNFFKKIWKHTFFDEYYRQRQINRTREEIKNTDNIYASRIKGDNKVAHENAMQGISERFISEYDGTLSEGEEKKLLDDKDPKVVKSSTNIKNLIIDYAKNAIDEDAFKNEKTRILNGLNGQDDILKGASNYADNLFEIAKNARIAVEHGAKLEELDLDTNIIIGKAKSSLKTEAHFNLVDRGIDKMKKSKIGRFISPAVLSTAIGLAYSISVGAGRKVMSSKAAAFISLGGSIAVSAAFAGANESQRVALERKQHGIEMAEGSKIVEGSKRREQLEKYEYQMESSNDLAQKLRDLMFEKDKDGKEVVKDIKEDELEKIFASLIDIEARNSLNAKNKIDLISYSNIGNVERERTDLTILTAKAKVELRKKIEGGLGATLMNGEKFDSYLSEQTQIIENILLGGEKGITAQDKAFRRYKAGRIAKKMLQTAIGGLIIGGGIQEIAAFARDDVQGLVEGIFHHDSGATIQTPFENIHSWILGHPSHVDMGNAVDANFNGHYIKLPEGMSLLHNPDGTCDIMKGDQLVSDNVSLDFDANGNIDAESMTKLGEVGIIANTTHTVIDSTQEVTSNGNDYLNHHPGSTHHISRDGWYDNDTPKPIFDQNEIKLQWGGEMGTDANGNYVLDVSHMTSDGSFHNEFSVDAQEKMKDGGLKIILSLTQGTQHQTFEVPIDIHGNAVVDPNSEIGKLFFGNENGHAVFKGRFAEVVQSFGSHDGAEHVKSLATLVGPGNDSITDTIVTHIDNPITTIQPSMETQPQMFVPMVARRPLESVTFGKKEKGKDTKTSEVASKEQTLKDGDNNGGVILSATGPWSGEKGEKQKPMNEITQEEYDGMQDDLKMLNRKIQTSQGIIVLEESDFKSTYGKKRYEDLKSIGGGIPVSFNKDELQNTGDEMEEILRNSKIVSKEKIENETRDRAYKIYLERQEKGLGGNEKTDWEEAEKQLKEERGKKLESKEEPIKENSQTSKEIQKVKDETKKVEDKTPKFEDLSKKGTEFEDEFYKFKVLGKAKLFRRLIGNKIEVEATNKKTGKTEIGYFNGGKKMKEKFENGKIKITKISE